jgi:quercetin dioxygenase-like cupin family protein
MSFEPFSGALGDRRSKWVEAHEGSPLLLPGWTMRVKIAASDTSGAMTLIEASMAPGHRGPAEHVHVGHDEAFFVLEGALRFRVGDTYRTATVGETVFASRGLAHGFSNAETVSARYLVALTPSGYEVYFERLAALIRAHGAMPDRETLAALMAEHGTFLVDPVDASNGGLP